MTEPIRQCTVDGMRAAVDLAEAMQVQDLKTVTAILDDPGNFQPVALALVRMVEIAAEMTVIPFPELMERLRSKIPPGPQEPHHG